MKILRSIAAAFVTLYYTTTFILLRVLGAKPEFAFEYARKWLRAVFACLGITLKVEGASNIKQSETYVFIANHASQLDIPTMLLGLPCDARIMYKKELEKIPFMGWAFALSAHIPVRRTDARSALSSVEEIVENIRKGWSAIVYAEGTRSKTGTLAPFKRGAFVMATRSNKPIVPCAIINTFQLLPSGKLLSESGEIILRIGKPIPVPEELNKVQEKELMDTVHKQVQQLIEQ